MLRSLVLSAGALGLCVGAGPSGAHGAHKLALRGALDGVPAGTGAHLLGCTPACGESSYSVSGWAVSPALAGGRTPVVVSILVDGKAVASALANHSRPDLVKAGVAPDPLHGFAITLPPSVAAQLGAPTHTPLRLSARVGDEVLPGSDLYYN